MPYVTIPFAVYDPNPNLEGDELLVADNVAPYWQVYRLIQKIPLVEGKSSSGDEALFGMYSHPISEERLEQIIVPDGDIAIGDWVGPEGEVTDLWSYVDERDTSADDFIQVLGAPSAEEIRFTLSNPADAPTSNDNHTLSVDYKVQGSSGSWTINVELLEGVTSIASEDITGSADTDWVNWQYTLANPGEADTIVGYGDLRLHITATVPGTSSSQNVMPVSDYSRGGWIINGGGTDNLWDEINDSSNSNFIRSAKLRSVGSSSTYKCDLADLSEDPPSEIGTYTVKYSIGTSAAPEPNTGIDAIVSLYEGSTLIAEETRTNVPINWTLYSFNLTAGEKASISDWAKLRLHIRAYRNGGSGDYEWKLNCGYARLEVPSSTGAFISAAKMYLPTDVAEIIDDEIEVYGGDSTNLWKRNGYEWDDVTRLSSDYGLLGSTTAWDFTSFGQNVIATNFSDEVQVKAPSDTEFDDLITNPSPGPKARYCGVINSHLILGDINFTGPPAGQPHEIWWSALDDPTDFEISLETGADRQALVATPGRVTGIVGMGDWGLIFKRDSIYRLDYVGQDQVFNINVLADGIGTRYSKSIVPFGGDVYFFSGSSFAVVRGGQQVDLNIGGNFRNIFFNEKFSNKAIAQYGDTNPIRVENTIIGAPDHVAGLIWWIYRSAGDQDSYFNHVRGMIYNPFEDRWSHLYLDPTDAGGLEINQICSYPSFFDISGENRGVIMNVMQGGYKTAVRFEDKDFYDGEFRTKFISRKQITGSPGYFKITGVRPIFTMDDGGNLPSSISVKIYDSNRPSTSSRVVNSESAVNMSTTGWIPTNASGEYMSVAVEINDHTIRNIMCWGVEIRWEPLGRLDA